MSQWSTELDRIEVRILVINQELNRLSRRFAQHEQALVELAAELNAATDGHREVPPPRKGKVSSAK